MPPSPAEPRPTAADLALVLRVLGAREEQISLSKLADGALAVRLRLPAPAGERRPEEP